MTRSTDPAPTDEQPIGAEKRLEQWIAVPHTQIHGRLRQALELAQDTIVILLMALLLVLALQALAHLARLILIEKAAPPELLSEVVYVLILTELYRTLIYYLREHRISVILMLEVAIVSVLRDQILATAQRPDWQRVVSGSLLLLVLGALLFIERSSARARSDTSEVSAH